MTKNNSLKHSNFQKVKGCASTVIDGETVILHVETGKYCGLNEVGSLIWETLETKSTFSNIVEKVTQHFNVTEEICTPDILVFLKKLQENNLVDVSPQ